MGLEDIMGIVGGGGGGGSGLLPPLTGFFSTVAFFFIIGVIGMAYTFEGFTLRNIGRKAGLIKDWMAFVPFARTVYRLAIIREPWWKMFFLEYSWVYFLIIRWFFGLFDNSTMTTFGDVLAVLYVLFMICFNVYYRNKFYKAFGVKNELSIGIVTTWGLMFFTKVIDLLIAFTNLINHGERNLDFTSIISPDRGSGRAASAPSYDSRPAGGVTAPPAHVSSTGGSLTGMSGMYAGQEIPIVANDEVIIGRDAAVSNIIIDQNAEKVSRKHCGIRFDAVRGAYSVTDYSSNGTTIEGGSKMITNLPQSCPRGTVIALGSRENRFRLN